MKIQYFLTERLQQAITMAIEVHTGQLRKGDGQPYIEHPISVLALLAFWGADENTLIAGLLHDVIEDTKNDLKRVQLQNEIRDQFGNETFEVIDYVTAEPNDVDQWIERKLAFHKRLQRAPMISLLVRCADQTHNAYSLLRGYCEQGEPFWKNFNATRIEKLWFLKVTYRFLKRRIGSKYTAELGDLLKSLEIFSPYRMCHYCGKTPNRWNQLPFTGHKYIGSSHNSRLCKCRKCRATFIEYCSELNIWEENKQDIDLVDHYWVPLNSKETEEVQSGKFVLTHSSIREKREYLHCSNTNTFAWKKPEDGYVSLPSKINKRRPSLYKNLRS